MGVEDTTPPGRAVGAVFGCTSSTMVIPVLQQLDIRGPAAIVLILEAALGDIVSVVLVGSLLETSQGDTLVTELIIRFVVRITVAVIAAILAGFVWSRARSRLSADRFSSVLNIGGILSCMPWSAAVVEAGCWLS